MTNRASAVAPLLLFGLLLAGVTPTAAQAPRDTIPRNPDAELLFEQGVAAYERGDYATAYDRFRLVIDYPLHRKTTAALLMGGKALVQLGRYRKATDLVSTLLDQYPQTSYRSQARELMETARRGQERAGTRPDTLRIGVLLPMNSADVTLSQALFNGIRLAVDEHNGVRRRYVPPAGLRAVADSFDVYDTAEAVGDSLAAAAGSTTVATATDTVRVDSLRIVTERTRRPPWIAKMHFQPAGDSAAATRAAVDSLARVDDADIIVGPLYSPAARAAGAAAEKAEVLLVPPLASFASVSAGRDYVFQTNPTIPLRGRLMARFLSESLLVDQVAVIHEQDDRIGSSMAATFQKAARSREIDVPFTLRLPNVRDWSRLPEVVEADSTVTDSIVAATKAVYLPMSGRNAAGKIQDALAGLGRLNPNVRVFGNAEWHDLPIRKQASQFTVTYTNDFYVRTRRPEVQTFVRRYRLLTGTTPEDLSVRGRRLAYTGYDVARFLLGALAPSPTRPEPAALRAAARYEGLGLRIDFEGGNVNRAMFLHRYRDNRLELLR